MKTILIIQCLVAAVTLPAFAKIQVLAAMKVQTDIPKWSESYRVTVDAMTASKSYPADGYTECRPVVEVSETYLCLSNTQKGMNSSLGRASSFIEGAGASDSNEKGHLVRQDDENYLRMKTMIGGHDLKGADLLRFHQKVTSEEERN